METYKVALFYFGIKDKNDMIYSEDNISLDILNKKEYKGRIDYIHLSYVSYAIKNITKEYNILFGELEILNNPSGIAIQTLLEHDLIVFRPLGDLFNNDVISFYAISKKDDIFDDINATVVRRSLKLKKILGKLRNK